MATQRRPATVSTESAHNASFIEPSGAVPEINSTALVKVDRKIATRYTAKQHHDLIQLTAYHLAESRDFVPGHESEDWATAEILVVESAGLPVT